MRVRLRDGLPPGTSHEQRLQVARRLAQMIVERHGDKIAAVVVFGSASIGADGPWSDLDITAVTTADLGRETKCYTWQDLTINLDYQTIEESFEEAREPHGGGCWVTALSLHDPHGIVDQFRAAFRGLTVEDCRNHFVVAMRDHLATHIGKLRNAALAEDRAALLDAAAKFAEHVCRALCMLNDNADVTGLARLRSETKKLRALPPDFTRLIDPVAGAVPGGDQQIYDAAEDLWGQMKRMAAERGLQWQSPELVV